MAGVILIGKLILCDLLHLLYCFYVFFLSKTIDFKKYGKWAVVTGATDGIGKAYSQQLAKRGMNVVLVSRTLSKLEDVAAELREKYSIETKVITVDFSSADIYDVLTSELADLEIGVLVNNVGMSYGDPSYFHEVLTDVVESLINVNILSVTKMTRIVLPQMLERKKGIILNIGSMAGYATLPLLSEYSGSKAFVDFFTRGIQAEYKDKNSIIIQYIAPGAVSTKFSKMRPNLLCPVASSYASSSLRSVGKLPLTTGCFAHEFQFLFTDKMPDFILVPLLMKILTHKSSEKEGKLKAQ